MPEKTHIVGASHDFHDAEYAEFWASSFEVTPERLNCFKHMGDKIELKLNTRSYILELGSGPGYFASYILKRFPKVSYVCMDYSASMIDIARSNLKEFGDRVTFIQVDLRSRNWIDGITQRFSAIASTWALHDLESREYTSQVYAQARILLEDAGVFINSDFIKPLEVDQEFEPGRYFVDYHIEDFLAGGYSKAECSMRFETDLYKPASHNNYACIIGTA